MGRNAIIDHLKGILPGLKDNLGAYGEVYGGGFFPYWERPDTFCYDIRGKKIKVSITFKTENQEPANFSSLCVQDGDDIWTIRGNEVRRQFAHASTAVSIKWREGEDNPFFVRMEGHNSICEYRRMENGRWERPNACLERDFSKELLKSIHQIIAEKVNVEGMMAGIIMKAELEGLARALTPVHDKATV